jgi:HAD superfamily hydrolase (TIGR01490 family)
MNPTPASSRAFRAGVSFGRKTAATQTAGADEPVNGDAPDTRGNCKLAIFDLDNTLLNGDSDYGWGCFLADKGIVDPAEYRQVNQTFYEQYKAGTLDIYKFIEFAFKPLAANKIADLLAWREEFMRERVEDMVLPKAEALIDEHRAKGHILLIITSTNRFVTEPIARRLGIEHLLATDPEMRDSVYTGKISGTPCFREGKIARLRQWLKERQLDPTECWFYSDSHNDLPLLQQVDHPVAVDPDPMLLEYARRRLWPVISLR